jgi:hypothetical protein
MGTKYSSQSTSGYNSSPPVDDGTVSEANKVKWSTIKTKLADVLKTFGEAINTALVTALDQSCRTVTASDSAAATDHNRTIQVTTSSVTITLASATSMAAGYIVSVANQSAGNITVALATATDTIDTVTNTTQTIGPLETRRYIVNTAATGYITASRYRNKQATRQVFTSGSGTYTTPAGATRINLRMVGGGGGGGGVGTANQTAGGAGGDTTFSTLTASGGGASAGAVGTGTNGDINISGTLGGGASTGNFDVPGGDGGGTPFGGGAPGGAAAGQAGKAAPSNSGAGGGGGGGSSGGTYGSAAGGSSGGYVEKLITSPAATYAYAVGAAGTAGGAGTGGNAGGAGGSGLVIVDEYYD